MVTPIGMEVNLLLQTEQNLNLLDLKISLGASISLEFLY